MIINRALENGNRRFGLFFNWLQVKCVFDLESLEKEVIGCGEEVSIRTLGIWFRFILKQQRQAIGCDVVSVDIPSIVLCFDIRANISKLIQPNRRWASFNREADELEEIVFVVRADILEGGRNLWGNEIISALMKSRPLHLCHWTVVVLPLKSVNTQFLCVVPSG